MELRHVDSSLRLVVRDDGEGFEVPRYSGPGPAQEKNLGLLGMKERAALVSGSIEIISAPGNGTVVEIVLPFASEAATSSSSGNP